MHLGPPRWGLRFLPRPAGGGLALLLSPPDNENQAKPPQIGASISPRSPAPEPCLRREEELRDGLGSPIWTQSCDETCSRRHARTVRVPLAALWVDALGGAGQITSRSARR
ncbi:unnamed protein product [Tetraodon nigroviridis]|uniref:(spotted green pufferfish) hypothetical protein n=1 Tax=Tetraodon nigroviridis TaxID=99883 RepID=Q4S8K8_TETNG|nr:unnamed protein product [Tetraodon nigroviridis]